MAPLCSDELYSVAFLAGLAKVHVITVYQSLTGRKKFPLPPAVRLGRAVRFRGSDIQVWLEGLQTQTHRPAADIAMAMEERSLSVRRRRGRPTKSMQIAKRAAGVSHG